MVKLIGVGVSLGIVVINTALQMIIKKLAEFEAYSTRTKFNISVAQKSALA
jgi:hypothetical protein